MSRRLVLSSGVAAAAVLAFAAAVPVIGQAQNPRTPWGDPDHHPLPLYECHEGNHGFRNILSAARAEEKARKP